nr:hypothetical protein [Mycolicibacterium mengxianglii]
MLELAQRLHAHAEEFAQLGSRNVGKPISVAREEIPFGVDNMVLRRCRPGARRPGRR